MDNDLSTRWTAEGLGSWITYDLGEEQTVASTGVAFYQGTERIAYFQIATSVDGANWSSPTSFHSSGATNDIQLFDLMKVRALLCAHHLARKF